MRNRIFLLSLTAFLFYVNFLNAQTNAGNTGMSFLKFGVGAREMALAEVPTGISVSPFQAYYNPALLSKINQSSIGFMHNEWLQSVKSEFLIANFSLFKIPFSFSLNSTNIPDIEIRTKPGEKEGTFNAHYLSVGLATGFNLFGNLDFGLGSKFLYENIFSNEASGYAFDFGLVYSKFLDYSDISFSVRNLGSMGNLLNESSKLPSDMKIGVSLSEPVKLSKFNFSPAIQIQKYFDIDGIQFLAGIETTYDNFLAIRLGYRSNKELNGFSAGLGFNYYGVSLDYAFLPFNNNFGSANIFSVFINL